MLTRKKLFMFYVDSDSETQKVCKYSDVHIQIQGNATRHHTIAEGKTK